MLCYGRKQRAILLDFKTNFLKEQVVHVSFTVWRLQISVNTKSTLTNEVVINLFSKILYKKLMYQNAKIQYFLCKITLMTYYVHNIKEHTVNVFRNYLNASIFKVMLRKLYNLSTINRNNCFR